MLEEGLLGLQQGTVTGEEQVGAEGDADLGQHLPGPGQIRRGRVWDLEAFALKDLVQDAGVFWPPEECRVPKDGYRTSQLTMGTPQGRSHPCHSEQEKWLSVSGG